MNVPRGRTATRWDVLCRRLGSDHDDVARGALEQVFLALRGELVRFVNHIVHDVHVSHDLVQDTFVDLWNLRRSLETTTPLRPYLFGMARNRALRFLRDRATQARKHDEIRQERSRAPVGLPNTFDAEVMSRRLAEWLDTMPARQREALILSRFHQLSHAEIARVMEISPRTVNNHIMRALEYLEARLQQFETPE